MNFLILGWLAIYPFAEYNLLTFKSLLIMKLFKKKFQIVFVLFLSVIFVHCSSSVDIDDIDDLRLAAPNTYDIKLTKAGSETIHYKGSLSEENASYSALMEGFRDELGNVKIATLSITDNDLTMIGLIALDKNNKPYPFNGDDIYDDDELKGSTLMISDNSKGRHIVSNSGSLTMSKFKIHTTSQSAGVKAHLISYVLEFKGDFVVTRSGQEEIETYFATGKIVMSPYR